MAEITKYNVYLSEQQEHRLQLLSTTTGRDPEQIVNEAVYSYLAIVDPFATDDTEPPEDQTEILFTIPDDKAAQLDDLCSLEGVSDRDEYARQLLLLHIG